MIPPPTLTADSPLDAPAAAPVPMTEPRPMYWSVRRELWENRSIVLAPIFVTLFVLFASLISIAFNLLKTTRSLSPLDPAKQHAGLIRTFQMAPAPIMLATFIVGVFYAIDALYGERRDRSILFWKSLPVSDRTAVLSKASIPLVVLPLIAFVLSVAAQLNLLVVSTAALVSGGVSPAPMWTELGFFEGLLIMLYGLTVHALWFAPIYGWLLLVSAWARRAPILWAVLPFLAVSAVERIAFRTTHFLSMLQYRVGGAMAEAFVAKGNPGQEGNIQGLSELDPGRFLTRPGLWLGLIFAAAFLAAAVRLRRNREPI